VGFFPPLFFGFAIDLTASAWYFKKNQKIQGFLYA